MNSLGKTIEELARARQQWLRLFSLAGPQDAPADPTSILFEVPEFGANPGNLKMLAHVPARAVARPALVVVLHGCGQSPQDYERRAGWAALASERGFILCYPEQKDANNGQTCFNWFSPRLRRRDAGEAASIRSMIEWLCSTHGVDRSRIFITGFSAGGAMAVALLAAYPEIFAAGAVIAGLPFGAADNIPSALEAMSGGDARTGAQLAAAVREAAPAPARWPRLSVWHGRADDVVVPANATALVRQWRHLLDLVRPADLDERLAGGRRHRVWRGRDGRDMIEFNMLDDVRHAIDIQSSAQIADFFGLKSRSVIKRALEKTRILPDMRSQTSRSDPS